MKARIMASKGLGLVNVTSNSFQCFLLGFKARVGNSDSEADPAVFGGYNFVLAAGPVSFTSVPRAIMIGS